MTAKLQRNYPIPTKRPVNFSTAVLTASPLLPGKVTEEFSIDPKLKSLLRFFKPGSLPNKTAKEKKEQREKVICLFLGAKDSPQYFNKLAQLRKPQLNQPLQKGKTPKTDEDFFTQKQRAKYIGFALAKKLNELDSPLKKSYLNSMFCNHIIEKSRDKVTSKYCKNRICPICNRIRTAQLINSYLPEFQKWEELTFITLTIPNVPEPELKDAIARMQRAFKKIKDVLRKRKEPLKCVWKLEITKNPHTNEVHPHAHIICEYCRGDVIALWKKYLPEINYLGQDIKPATEGSAKELFKYFSKVIFKGKFDAPGLDNILQAVRGKRVFQSSGFTLSEEQKIAEGVEKLQSQQLTIKRYLDKIDGEYEWRNDLKTWFNKEDSEILHPYKIHKKTEKLVSKINGTTGSPGTGSPGTGSPGTGSPGTGSPGAKTIYPAKGAFKTQRKKYEHLK
jgi:hypothetical protein